MLCVESGPPMLLIGLAPSSALDALPSWLIRVWGLTLTLGGALVLTGIGLRYVKEKYVVGSLIERAGYAPLVSGTLVFAVIIELRTGLKGLLPIMTYVAFAGASALRYRQIGKTLERIRDRDHVR